jgi:hypothetical protein
MRLCLSQGIAGIERTLQRAAAMLVDIIECGADPHCESKKLLSG